MDTSSLVTKDDDLPREPSWLNHVWDFLTAPSRKLVDVDDQHKARLLASLLALLIPLGFGLTFMPSILQKTSPWLDPVFYVSFPACTSLVVAYILSRTSRYYFGTAIALGVMVAAVLGASFADPDPSEGLMTFMLIPILLAGLLLSVRWLVALITVCLTLIATMPLMQGSKTVVDTLIGEFSLTLVISIMLVMLLDYRSRVEYQRRAVLAASEQRYRKLVEHSPDMIAVQRDGRLLYINSAGMRLLGIESLEQALSLPPMFAIPEEDRARLIEVQRSVTTEQSQRSEFKMRRLDGQLIDVEGTATQVDFFGEPAIQIVIRDITQRKLTETETRRLRLGIEHSGEAIFMTDPDGRIVYVNPAFERIYGYSREEAIGQTPRIIKSDETLPETHAALWRMLLGKHVVYGQMTNRRKDGLLLEVESTVSPVLDEQDKIIGFLAIQRDITERRLADQALHYYATRLELLHSIDHDILKTPQPQELAHQVLDHLSKFVQFRRATIVLFDFPNDLFEVLAASGVELNNLNTGAKAPLGIFEGIDSLKAGKHHVNRTIDPTQTLSDADQQRLKLGIKAYVRIPMIAHGHLIGALNVGVKASEDLNSFVLDTLHEVSDQIAIAVEDMRLRKALELHSEQLEGEVHARTQEIRAIKDRAEAILNSAPDCMLMIRSDGRIEMSNDVFLQMFGYSPNEVHQAPISTLISVTSRTNIDDALALCMDQRKPIRREIIARRKDGSTFDADLAFAPIEGNGEIAGVVCSLRDISAIKDVERMKDQFVSNVSHELRTPITSLKLYHQLLIMNPNKYQDYIVSLNREMHRLERIVEDLLLLSRLDQKRVWVGKAATDLNKLIEDYITDRGPMAKQRQLDLSFEPQPDLPMMLADRSLVGHVLSILMTNALSYTPPGGSVKISTHAASEHSEMVGFSVCDTGPGIPPDERGRLFERFFRGSASRAVNAPGTGLGLAIAREIVDLHGGRIEVNAPDPTCVGDYPGAVFSVWMPKADKEIKQPASSN